MGTPGSATATTYFTRHHLDTSVTSLLATLLEEIRVAARQTAGATVRLALVMAAAATGLLALWLGVTTGDLALVAVGTAVGAVAAAGMVHGSATATWLRARYRGRTWRWS